MRRDRLAISPKRKLLILFLPIDQEVVTGHFVHGHRAGGKESPTYASWRSMISRCTRPTHPRYPDYGGRGIQVDPRWTVAGGLGFAAFLADMGVRPVNKTLDRRDGDGHYTPDNCQWADIKWQRWNRRDMRERSEDVPDEFHVEPLFVVKQVQGVQEVWPF